MSQGRGLEGVEIVTRLTVRLRDKAWGGMFLQVGGDRGARKLNSLSFFLNTGHSARILAWILEDANGGIICLSRSWRTAALAYLRVKQRS